MKIDELEAAMREAERLLDEGWSSDEEAGRIKRGAYEVIPGSGEIIKQPERDTVDLAVWCFIRAMLIGMGISVQRQLKRREQ